MAGEEVDGEVAATPDEVEAEDAVQQEAAAEETPEEAPEEAVAEDQAAVEEAAVDEAAEEPAVEEETPEAAVNGEVPEETLEETVAEEAVAEEEVAEEAAEAAVEEETLEATVDGDAEATAADEVAEEKVPAEEAEAEEAVAEEATVEEAVEDEALAEELLPEKEEPGEDDVPMDNGENGEEGEDMTERLQEAIEGSQRLKRMMEEMEENDAQSSKKPKTHQSDMIDKLMVKWNKRNDLAIKHCLQNVPVESLDDMDKNNYVPESVNRWSLADNLKAHAMKLHERKGIDGGANDCLALFRFRWKLTMVQDKRLRSLRHKDLRYVLNNFDGTEPLEEVIAEAAGHQPEELCTENAVPNSVGLSAVSRFNRLELIDPLADSAIFGDANLTFALRLAAHRKNLGHVGRVIATTFEDLKTLRERYKEIDQSIATLQDHYAEVHHSVDCTRIAVDPRFKEMESSLGAVYYNFPHSGAVGGFFDGHPLVNWRHENLMRLFFRALRSFVKPGGCVKVSSNMSAVGVRYSYIVESAVENEFVHVETMPFLEWHLHRYGRSYGDRRDAYKRPDEKNNESYNAQQKGRDMVYCFRYAPTGAPVGEPNVRLPPSVKTLMSSEEGPFQNMPRPAKEKLAKQLFHRFLTEISGTHVG